MEPCTGMIAVLEDVAVVEAMEENITAETRAHCTCMVPATAVEEKSGIAVAEVAMDIGFGTRAAGWYDGTLAARSRLGATADTAGPTFSCVSCSAGAVG